MTTWNPADLSLRLVGRGPVPVLPGAGVRAVRQPGSAPQGVFCGACSTPCLPPATCPGAAFCRGATTRPPSGWFWARPTGCSWSSIRRGARLVDDAVYGAVVRVAGGQPGRACPRRRSLEDIAPRAGRRRLFDLGAAHDAQRRGPGGRIRAHGRGPAAVRRPGDCRVHLSRPGKLRGAVPAWTGTGSCASCRRSSSPTRSYAG